MIPALLTLIPRLDILKAQPTKSFAVLSRYNKKKAGASHVTSSLMLQVFCLFEAAGRLEINLQEG